MLTTANIDAALRQHLPADLHPAIPLLAQTLAEASTGAVSSAEAQARLAVNPGLADALRALQGQQVTADSTLISFGTGTQMGDISVGDVAGKDVIKLHINISRLNTVVGDYVEGNIDRRQGTFIDQQTVINIARSSQLTPQGQRNRQAMIQKVRTIWIRGLLERSLEREVRIALRLTEKPEAVEFPLNVQVQELQQSPRSLWPDSSICSVFDELGQALLILGVPGAGKTTLLLELTRELLVRAEQNPTCPMPVIFNLSSWTTKRQPLVHWLIEELVLKYDVPRSISQKWVSDGELLPLLDGLDEVPQSYRAGAVEVINVYRQNHGLAPLVVCSRIADYEALATRLRLHGAIVVQALSVQQIDQYLKQGGERLKLLSTVLQRDRSLYVLAETPLMLNVLTLTYCFDGIADRYITGSSVNQQFQLLSAYIRQMLSRKGVLEGANFSPERTMHWLAWLASYMERRSQSIFYLEELHPDIAVKLGYGNLYRAILVVPNLAFFGLGIGISVGLVIGLITNNTLGVVVGSLVGLVTGVISLVISFRNAYDPIQSVEQLQWSWPVMKKSWASNLAGSIFAATIAGVIALQLIVASISFERSLLSVMIFGVGIGIAGTLIDSVRPTDSIEARTRPNQGIWRSAKNAFLIRFGIGLIAGLFGGLGFGYGFGIVGMVVGFLAGGLLGGLSFGSNQGIAHYGGHSFLKHFALRAVLSLYGHIPWDYVRFCDFCANQILLRRVGGGYIFIHRLLMEHFASMTDEDIARIAGEVEKTQTQGKRPK